jgi:hypothetical protein
MAMIPPPPPISFEEFEKRKAAGATTMEEFDPALAKWMRSGPVGLLFRRKINKELRKRSP